MAGGGDEGNAEGLVVCVTGACGGVGSTICRLLGEQHTAKPVFEIRALDLVKPAGSNFTDLLANESKSTSRPVFKYIAGSVLDETLLRKAFAGCNVVIHAASLIDYGTGDLSPTKLLQVNVEGMRCVIRACRASGVSSLVYTSSTTAISHMGHNRNLKSDAPYPAAPQDYSGGLYAFSKAIAESLCVAADNSLCSVQTSSDTKDAAKQPQMLRTCALRLRNVYGEHDQVLVPQVVQAGLQGLMSFRIGMNEPQQDNMYIGNAAYGHLCAINVLQSEDQNRISKIAGRALNLSHEEPRSFYEAIAPFLEAFDIPVPTRRVPAWIMSVLAHIVVFLLSLIPRALRPRNSFTPESVLAIVDDMTFTDEEALHNLGFSPLFSIEEANCRTIKWLKEEWSGRPTAASPESTSNIPQWALLGLLAGTLGILFFQVGLV
ncbi:3 beta-hydroxysteroid dehydrogenase type 3 [Hondaea fermentalgiana]|uniref:3 beta-hydroxysteroid dehydrogenase type 3 n=1 Tax=Hondaea fermentalgiana TaxID=2315210 RepID=A0A2R5GT05_9STRA|nr:3 beta-hydroxysteroid dehydrogenase type 3 [Hondaea fermentalgiana]|eukprot:GBG33992.1 3 beta-hydroxysteroid dehydrogenase type 3 [Hondaea fermentalgiana]